MARIAHFLWTFGLRWVCAVAITLIYFALVFFPLPNITGKSSSTKQLRYVEMKHQESGEPWQPKEPNTLRTQHKIAIIITLPTVLITLPVLFLLHVDSTTILCVNGFLVPLLWFVIGRWVDIQVGILPHPQWRENRLWQFGRVALVVVTALVFIVFVQAARLMNRESFWIVAGLLTWSGFLFFVATLNLMQFKKSHRRTA